MSYLTLPQLTFKGKCFCNPATGNNNDYANVFDIDKLAINPRISPIDGSTVQIPDMEQIFTDMGPQDAAGLRAWLMGLIQGQNLDGGQYGQQGHWNYYGDNATRFEQTTVTGYAPLTNTSIPANDPLLGATVSIVGNTYFGQQTDPVIVDVDPYALVTSQIFSYGIQVTGTDGTVLINGTGASRAFSYFIYIYKNVDPAARGFQPVSSIFISSVPSAQMQINSSGVNSPALSDLAAAVKAGAGLNMRYCFYNAIYDIEPQDLQKSFAHGQYIPNPYKGLVLGTIGVLQPGELLTAPLGRKMYVQNRFQYQLGPGCGSAPVPANAPERVVPVSKGPMAQPAPPPKRAALSCTLAHVDSVNRIVWLDTISTFPECNVQTNQKLNLGVMQLHLLYGGGQRVPIGPIDYSQDPYEAPGGMASISCATNPQAPLIDQNIATGTLSILSVDRNQDLLLEILGIDIATDDRAIYFQEQGSATISIQVRSKGQPPQTDTPLNLEYWMCAKDFVNPSKPQVAVVDRYFTVEGATQLPNTSYSLGLPPFCLPSMNQQSVITDRVTVPPGGKLTLNLTALRSGVSMIRFADPSVAP
jgi:hypothetical protein